MIPISEIFASINGEGLRQGFPAVFVRTFGCNLRCAYCDSKFSYTGSPSEALSVNQIIERVKTFGLPRVTVTGGEPLVHPEVIELVEQLAYMGYEVEIETNGAVDIAPVVRLPCTITMDVKCPSSGCCEIPVNNLNKLRTTDCVKFVVQGSDLNFVQRVMTEYPPACTCILSPVYGGIEPMELAEFLKRITSDLRHTNLRMQLQLHKIIWPDVVRGV